MTNMSVSAQAGHLDIDAERFRRLFDREPMEFSHNLSGLELFKIESLRALAKIMDEHPGDYSVTSGAASGGTNFFSVPMMPYKAHEAIENLDGGAFRILLKRPENHDPRFKALMLDLYEQVKRLLGLDGEKLVRLEGAILITSAATITPFHYDPEVGIFSHIEGEKIYHVYSPGVIRETELERFSICGPVALAPVELDGRDPDREHVFRLTAGKGFHQPQNAPHWVETGSSRSISYTFVFETEAMRAVARTRLDAEGSAEKQRAFPHPTEAAGIEGRRRLEWRYRSLHGRLGTSGCFLTRFQFDWDLRRLAWRYALPGVDTQV